MAREVSKNVQNLLTLDWLWESLKLIHLIEMAEIKGDQKRQNRNWIREKNKK